MGLLAILFLLFLPKWGKWVYGESGMYARYGLHWTRRNGVALVQGLSIGISFVLGLFALMAMLGWVRLQPAPHLLRFVAEGLLSALGVGFAEELFFRGWLLDELERDYAPRVALGVDAVIFATLHFIKPLAEILRTFPQFPGLILLGLALVGAKRSRRNCLGIAIGLHAGLVWGYYVLNVGKVVQYPQVVPEWVTGIDRNPLAGAMGLVGLSILALVFSSNPKFQKPIS